MERKRKGIQVYAIIVCIVAIVTFIICFSIMISAIIDRSDPVNAGRSRQDLSSFESYKMQTMKTVKTDQAYVPSNEELRSMYEAAKEDSINRVMHRTKRDLIVTGLLVVFCLILFGTHFYVLKKYNRTEE